MFTFKQLVEEKTQEEVLIELKKFLEDLGILTTNWKPGSPSQTNLQLDAYIYKQLMDRVASQSKNQLNQFATGEALTQLALSRFANKRVLADRTIGYMNVSSSAEIQPRTWLPGELKVTDPNNNLLIFSNVETITVSSTNAENTYKFQALQAGESYNIASDVTMSFVSTINGLEVTNPAYGTNSDTWITSQGSNEESDNALRARNETKFASLQRGETINAGVSNIIYEATQMEFVKIDDTNPRGPGSTDIYIANPLSIATDSQVSASQVAMNANSFQNENYNSNSDEYRNMVYAAEAQPWDRELTIWYEPNLNATDITLQIYSVMDDLVSTTPIGGLSFTVNGGIDAGDSRTHHLPYSEVVDRLMDIEGVRRVSSDDTTDIEISNFKKLLRPSDYDTNLWSTVLTIEKLDASTFSTQ